MKLGTAHRWRIIEAIKINYFSTGVKDVATTIALTAKQDTIVVTKSTVPVGTNDRLRQIIDHNKLYHINIEIVSDIKFLKEESAIYDSFYVDRIVIKRKTIKSKFPISLGSCVDI